MVNNSNLSSPDPLSEHHKLMVHFKSLDKEVNLESYRFFIDYFSPEGINLDLIEKNLHFRFYSPLWEQLVELQATDRGDKIVELLKKYKPRFFLLDNLQILDILPINAPEYTPAYLEFLRFELGPLYPDIFPLQVITIFNSQDPNGPKINLLSWNTADYDFMKNLLESYEQWLKNHIGILIPQFQEIAEELSDYFARKYDGIRPKKKGFISWFITEKLGTLKLSFVPMLNSPIGLITIDYSNLNNVLTPELIDRHLREYCEWRLNRLEEKDNKDSAQVKAKDLTYATINKPFTESELKQHVRTILAPLSGNNPQKERIMTQAEFERLITYTDHLVLTNTLPDNILPIDKTRISTFHITFTYYRLHDQLFGTKRIHKQFIDFLHSVFRDLNNFSSSTLKSRFSYRPPSYDKDFGL